MFNTPILFITFIRLDTAKKVFERIRQIQPKKLFIASDGPRKNKPEDKKKCDAVKNYILNNIDWDCDVHTLFRTENLGCGRGVSIAISWFFENVEQGIILEDDCVPSMSFFPFCENLLNRYKDEKSVYHISGNNKMGINKRPNNESYSFSAIEECWGWATWEDRWEKFEYKITPDYEKLKEHPYFQKKYRQKFWFQTFEEMSKDDNTGIWDFQYTYMILLNKGFCITPAKNLISNIGFGKDSTHFENGSAGLEIPSYEIDEIIHPKKLEFDWKLIKYVDRKVRGIPRGFFTPKYILFLLSRVIIFFPKLILSKMGIYDKIKSKIKHT